MQTGAVALVCFEVDIKESHKVDWYGFHWASLLCIIGFSCAHIRFIFLLDFASESQIAVFVRRAHIPVRVSLIFHM